MEYKKNKYRSSSASRKYLTIVIHDKRKIT